MITINSLKEMKKYYDKQLNTYVFDDDVKFNINIEVESNIKACNIEAYNIDAWNIDADDIYARDINACDIDARDINAWNIKAWNIKTNDITALGINAQDINYYAYCIAYYTFKCKSVSSDRVNSICKCLDKEIEYVKKDK